MSGTEGRFFFVHLQKTAGVALRMRLQHQFGEAAVYPSGADSSGSIEAAVESVASIKQLRRRYAARRDEIRVITGHFPLFVADVLGGGFTTVTVVREPVERTLSLLRHTQALEPHHAGASLEQLYADPDRFRRLAHNHMVKMFSLTGEEADAWMSTRVEFTPERLELAKRRLATVDAIGLQERFEEFCEGLERRFGWDLGPAQRVNETRHVEVSDDFRARIAADNAMDVELYEFARELYEERLSEASPARSRS